MLTTAGGLLFHAAPDGHFNAHDARTGEIVWQFQTGAPAGGPAAAFELDGEQYVSLVTSTNVWAFKLGSTLPPRPAPPSPREPEPFTGQVSETRQIETAALQRDNAFTGARFMTDEYQFNPYRTKVPVGTTVTWRNNGTMVHSAVAARRFMVHRAHRSGGGRRRDIRSTGHLCLHLQGTSVGVRADHRRIEGTVSGLLDLECRTRVVDTGGEFRVMRPAAFVIDLHRG